MHIGNKFHKGSLVIDSINLVEIFLDWGESFRIEAGRIQAHLVDIGNLLLDCALGSLHFSHLLEQLVQSVFSILIENVE